MKRAELTRQHRTHETVSVGRVTFPLLAALPWHLHPSGHGAVRAGQPDVHGAKRDTAHSSIQTGTLVLAAALESLSTLVHHSSKHTGGSLSSCGGGGNNVGKVIIQFTYSGHVMKYSRKSVTEEVMTSFFQWLTCADSYASVDGGTKVTVEAFV